MGTTPHRRLPEAVHNEADEAERYEYCLGALMMGGLNLFFRRRPRWVDDDESPQPSKLLSVEQLARHARVLGAHHRTGENTRGRSLLDLLDRHEQGLCDFNRTSLEATSGRPISPAAEWLLDNFYLIDEQIELARCHLPRGYHRELPVLVGPPLAGFPRIYGVVREYISHVDAQIEVPPLQAFMHSYQRETALKLGELWAVPIMLRLGLIEGLYRVAQRLTVARRDADLADVWVDRLQAVAEKNPSQLVIVVADMAGADLPLSSAFVAEFCQRLALRSSLLHLARTWLEQRVVEDGSTLERLIHLENQQQAADQVTVSHCIASLRSLSAIDWKGFVEELSEVDSILRTDPADVYARMDFSTRDQYRHVVETLARHSPLTESDLARAAIFLAEEAARGHGTEDRTTHVGYFLIDRGRRALARRAQVRWPTGTLASRVVSRFPLAFHFGGIAFLTALALGGGIALALATGVDALAFWLLAPCLLVVVNQAAVSVIHVLTTFLVKPSLLPRMDTTKGITAESRTIVVVPSLLSDAEGVDHLVEILEIHYLSNRDRHLHFALLTDFLDSETAERPGDEELLARAQQGVAALNRKYPEAEGAGFSLFHRPRRWNAAERVWMGHERKRGKLADFNGWLRGGATDRFSSIVGEITPLSSIKYVITLDADTQLPRDAARRLVGTMDHRLNQPVFDPVRGVVVEGYGILQPRAGVSLPSARKSWFARLFAGEVGIDPYTREVSDVYQDLHHEGSFIGKGIYDVDAVARATAGRIPENTVLSHDLLEGCLGRAGLVSDVELYEAYPSRYEVDTARRHRWIRGDWQNLRWLGPRVRTADGTRARNPLSSLSRWKIFDNLRRSVVPVATLLFLIGSWILVPAWGAAAILLVIAMLAIPGVFGVIAESRSKPADRPHGMHWRGILGTTVRQVAQLGFTLAMLPHEAWISADAAVRTLFRLLFSRRRLLEWETARAAEMARKAGLGGLYRKLGTGPVLAIAVGAAIGWRAPEYLALALPLLLLWLLGPAIAWWIGQPLTSARPGLKESEVAFLHRCARKTWFFFETFVNERERWLPPDNFQEEPPTGVASRTSPTNIGLALLANLAARDFGYLSEGGLLRRTGDALASMQTLERFRGHFYNWYDTRTGLPLLPLYVSSVDSGNLAGHLLTLSAGLRELADEPLYRVKVFEGLRETIDVLVAMTGQACPRFHNLLVDLPSTPREGVARLTEAVREAGRIQAALNNEPETICQWASSLVSQCEDHLSEWITLAPWLALPPDQVPPEGWLRLDQPMTLRTLAGLDNTLLPSLGTDPAWAEFSSCLREGSAQARGRIIAQEALAVKCEALAAMDFTFLFDPERKLFATGYQVVERRVDAGFYDLLASEARLGSYVTIALGQVSQDHWFSMGRLLVGERAEPILVSWSGSMFEYLMPLLVMPTYEGTLLDHTCRLAVRRQIEYGALRGVPWGISESGYYRTDVHLNFQYRAFGVPGLGLKRGLDEDLVIAPYASALALMVAPVEACANLRRLVEEGREGAYGFYEAVDYTPSRLPPGATSVLLRSYMLHHQGMSLLAYLDILQGRPMARRFMACPQLKAAELLLQERVPRTGASVFTSDPALAVALEAPGKAGGVRVFTDPSPPTPELHLLSNGSYHVVLSSAGGGYSRWRDLAVTRWREDATRDAGGAFVYLRDPATGEFWSSSFQPTQRKATRNEVIFTEGRAEFRQHLAEIELHTEICVSPEDDVELKRIRITNTSGREREIELTSYAEVVLASPAADAAHPAFSNLFVQTEFMPDVSALLCTRRARSSTEQPPVLLHMMVGQGACIGGLSCETDRARFVGRGGSLARPQALREAGKLSDTVGSVLDPIVSLRCRVAIQPHQAVVVDCVLGMAEDRARALAMVDKYQNERMTDRAFDLAWTHSQVTLRQLNASEAEAQLYGRMAAALIYVDPSRRASEELLRCNRRGQSGLWSFGISGDVPIIVLQIGDPAKIGIVQQMIEAHAYWRTKGLTSELVILNEDRSVYRQALHEQILNQITSGIEAPVLDKPGGIFVRHLEQIPAEDRILLEAAARIVMNVENGTLSEQFEYRKRNDSIPPKLIPSRSALPEPATPPENRELVCMNGLGGFTPDGQEYVIVLRAGQTTPAPWVNVIANAQFGTVVSESGSAYSWSENAHEFRLTPWSNDPVEDSPGEAIYLRDEETGEVWSPTPLPARGATPYVIRHGFGYTVFEHNEQGIASEVWIYVAHDAPVKFTSVKLRNLSGRPRRLSVTGYCEWVLGELRSKNLAHVQTEIDLESGSLWARNHYNTEFAGRIVFFDVNDANRTFTGDRKEFIGRNGTLAAPAAMENRRLSGRVGAGFDPCGAIRVSVDLPPGQEREVTFRLGAGKDAVEARSLVGRFRQSGAGRRALEGVWEYWNRTLGAVNVDTPDVAVNVMANGWLLYQTLSCRLWGRTGFYQSGGAYGFRDQLQDVMALVHAEPGLIRAHLLHAASRQFREGDVQHWWHPPAGRGVRTRISDDYLWLPYVTCHYVSCVKDPGVLDEMVPFIDGRPVRAEEETYYDLPGRSEESATLYQHCVRAIEHGLRFGVHGLPLIEGGDWNDGMNKVGEEGRGESVWLGFFLHAVLRRFGDLALSRRDETFAHRCHEQARQLQERLEEHAWDGQWYLRAWFDDGTPLGSVANEECQIDSLPQSWSVLSGAGDPERSRAAMDSVDRRLVRADDNIIQLFDPPFDKSALEPGYIKGYIPGVRENGGQYTHGAIWTAMAFARMGRNERAWDLFNLLNPVRHGDTPEGIATYRVEPYVVAADVYAVAPHVGRGGWTWYTGSAGWMYRLLTETLLGLHREGDRLRLEPRLPQAWTSYKIHYRFHQTVYHITITRVTRKEPEGDTLTLDGKRLDGLTIPLHDDQRPHTVDVEVLG